MVHKTKVFGSTDADPGERFFYEVRNKVWLFARRRGLTPWEKALYGGSTLRRWVRTFRALAGPGHAAPGRCARAWRRAWQRPAPQRRGPAGRSSGREPERAPPDSRLTPGQPFSLLISTCAR